MRPARSSRDVRKLVLPEQSDAVCAGGETALRLTAGVGALLSRNAFTQDAAIPRGWKALLTVTANRLCSHPFFFLFSTLSTTCVIANWQTAFLTKLEDR